MKNLSRLFLLLLPYLAHAQAIIPTATQQPMWVFPIYVEDAIGQKDTVYFGYDPDATSSSLNTDKQFGEFHLGKDTALQAYMRRCFCWPGVDSIIKIDIRDTALMNQYNYFSITVTGVYPPIKLKWNPLYLYSDSINYPNQSPAPRAQIEIFTNYFYNIPPCPFLFSNEDILISDSVKVNCQSSCHFSDSLYFTHSSPVKSSFYFDLIFFPWYGCALNPSGIKSIEPSESVEITPNPILNKFRFDSKDTILKLEILSQFGIPMKIIYPININEVSVNELLNGVYFVKFYFKDESSCVKKIIINH